MIAFLAKKENIECQINKVVKRKERQRTSRSKEESSLGQDL
jgi:hypothetical protein